MKNILLICATLMVLPMGAQAKDMHGDAPKTTNLRGGVYMMTNPQGGNITISGGADGVFIVDDNLKGRGAVINDAIIAAAGAAPKFVLNTHYHFDHTGTNEAFGDAGAVIVAHENVRKRLSEEQFITFFKKQMPPMPKAGLPVVSFTRDMSIHFNDNDIKIMHLPNAHTDGDAAAYFSNDNVIAAGDVLFNNMYPFIDTEHGGSLAGVIAAIDVILDAANDDTLIVPGHGGLMTTVDVKIYRDNLAQILGNIKAAIKDGKTLAQTIAAKPTAAFDDTMGGGFIAPDAFVEIVYTDLVE